MTKHLPPSARYLGCDVSPVMIELAKQRLGTHITRSEVVLTDGVVQFPISDHSVDRVVSNYVLDLLSEEDIRRFFSEAHRTLMPDGKVCIASLTKGAGLPSRIVSSVWMTVFRMNPAIVGGCRPIPLDSFVEHQKWHIAHRRVVAPFGVPSEALVLEKKRPGKTETAYRGLRDAIE